MGDGLSGRAAAGVPLPASFYDRHALEVARDLLGAVVVRGDVAVRLTEVEAYGGPADPASHAFRGRTPRNAVMFGPPGRAYVYFSYGVHWCLNAVCAPTAGPAGVGPTAVLLRAGTVVAGVEVARERRAGRPDEALAQGPGNLTQALGVNREQYGVELSGWPGPLAVLAGEPVPDELVVRGPRIGLRVAVERPWRLWVAGARSVSRGRTVRAAGAAPGAAPGDGPGTGAGAGARPPAPGA